MDRFIIFVVAIFCVWIVIDMKPAINDVATNLVDPPMFVKAKIGPLPERFKPIIRQSYPELKTKRFQAKKEVVFSALLEEAKRQERWTLTFEDKEQGIVEGVAVTPLLRFQDDFVIRIREIDNESEVDMRSKSRIGIGDMGTNAYRISSFFELLSIPT